MERILSKEEISELLSAVEQGEIETGSELDGHGGASPISRLDLVRLPGPANWKMPNLDIVFDAFGRNFGASLTNCLQRSVIVKPERIESMPFDAALMTLTSHGVMGILSLEPFKAGGLLIFDEKLAFGMLEMQLGGAADGKFLEMNRAMTTIETNLIKIIMTDSCPDLEKAFSPIESLRANLLKIETNSRLINIVAPDAGVVAANFTVTIDDFSGMMTLILPHASLEPIRERLRDSTLSLSSQHNDNWPERLQQGIRSIQTTMVGQIAEINLKMRDILNFQVGDVIELGRPHNSQVRVLVEGQHKFNGLVGVLNGSKAVCINKTFLHGAEDGHN